MRWFRRGSAAKRAELDPGRQEALVQHIRSRFGSGAQLRYRDQVDELRALLDGDDGLSVAVRIVYEVADEAHAEVLARVAEVNRRSGRGYTLEGRNYRALWRLAGSELRPSLFALPCGFDPYVHLVAALQVLGVHARRCVGLTDPAPLVARVFELLDLTASGWEFGGVRVDADAADLASCLITAAQQLRMAVPEPEPLPPAARELMRRNNTTDVHDPTGSTVTGGINIGAQMRSALLT
jgi:hypothetical protein